MATVGYAWWLPRVCFVVRFPLGPCLISMHTYIWNMHELFFHLYFFCAWIFPQKNMLTHISLVPFFMWNSTFISYIFVHVHISMLCFDFFLMVHITKTFLSSQRVIIIIVVLSFFPYSILLFIDSLHNMGSFYLYLWSFSFA